MKKILIVDDDPSIGEMLEELLNKNGYAPLRATSGAEALAVISACPPDLILLDLMLPGICGEALLPYIKSIPVIVVSAKVGVEDKVAMLLSGAADYITKPFDTNELLARISVQLRSGAGGGELTYDDITLNVNDFTVTAGGKPVKLTKTEYAILLTLLKSKGKPVTKERIMSEIESKTTDCEENSLRTHVGNLRQKLKAAGGKDYIEAIWGIGYKLKS